MVAPLATQEARAHFLAAESRECDLAPVANGSVQRRSGQDGAGGAKCLRTCVAKDVLTRSRAWALVAAARCHNHWAMGTIAKLAHHATVCFVARVRFAAGASLGHVWEEAGPECNVHAPPWPSRQGVGVLTRRLQAQVAQEVLRVFGVMPRRVVSICMRGHSCIGEAGDGAIRWW